MHVTSEHLDLAGEWVAKTFSDPRLLCSTDLKVQAEKMFEDWSLGQNPAIEVDGLINALSFIRDHGCF